MPRATSMCPLESRVDSSKNHPRKGETMTTAEMATYAYDQIDQARAELNVVSK